MLSVPFWAANINYLAALGSGGVAVWLWGYYRAQRFYQSVIGVLVATCLVSLASGFMLSDGTHMAFWVRVLMMGELGQAAMVWAASASLRDSGKGRSGVAGVWGVAGVAMAALWTTFVIPVGPFQEAVSILELGPLGKVIYALISIAMMIGVAQMEVVLRTAPDPMRYQIKYVLIGLSGLAAFQVYFTTQILLLPVWESDLLLVGGTLNIFAVALVMFGVVRGGVLAITSRLYVSPQALVGSGTFLVVGAYLLAVGSLAEWFRQMGRDIGPVISLLFVFGGILALAVLLASRSVRIAIRDTVLRHFYRSKYDYRVKWLEVTEYFQGAETVDIILDRFRDLLARTFSAGTMSLWLYMDADGRFHQVRSVNVTVLPALAPDAPVICRLKQSSEPIVLDSAGREAGLQPDQALYVPVHRSDKELIAFASLSRGLDGRAYERDDYDLLRAIACHVGLLLTSAQMAEDRTSAAELDAFHRFAAFCMHDLKNLAGKLSLVVQNAQVHGESPQFQQAAMRTVSSTAQQMMDLIRKLSPRSGQGQLAELLDINMVIREVTGQLSAASRPPIDLDLCEVPPVAGVRAAFRQVIYNLLDNAQQAGGYANRVTVRTFAQGATIRVLVQDRGAGMAHDRLRTIFRPFMTTKEHGTGIGLYQCKTLIEAHGGTIRIESQLGEGTSVWLELPAAVIGQAGDTMRIGGEGGRL
ncbi:MAG: PEP-CTERM system histidine kinase PrsK [Nitrospira sp.]|jgi:putative PEP-CTERM system histidine kinase|nr:PEP-CTERM system histidine kinase PrsK [Nitrospira sp.]